MHSLGPYAVGIAFWAFVAVAVVAGVIGDYKKRRIELEPLRTAIERGQPIDPAIVERLTARPEHRDNGIDPLHLRLGAIMVIAVGAGMVLLALFLRRLAPVAFYPISGGAALLACIGIGLWIGARLVERQAQQPRHPPARLPTDSAAGTGSGAGGARTPNAPPGTGV